MPSTRRHRAPTFTHAELVADLDYNPITGKFLWRSDGTPAGSGTSAGYWRLSFRGHEHLAHRLAWFYITGSWPLFDIDHVNGVKDDNSAANLRQVTERTNSQNSLKPLGANKYRGVKAQKTAKGVVYRATICRDGVHLNLGRHATPELAYAAYIRAKRVFHPHAHIPAELAEVA
jgi:hypothetical protein